MYELFIRQKAMSLRGAFEVQNRKGAVVYRAQGQSLWRRRLVLLNSSDRQIGMIEQQFSLYPLKFDLYEEGREIGTLEGRGLFFHPRMTIRELGWTAQGNFSGWNYSIVDKAGRQIGEIHKEFFHLTDFYVLRCSRKEDAFRMLLMVLAIDGMITRS